MICSTWGRDRSTGPRPPQPAPGASFKSIAQTFKRYQRRSLIVRYAQTRTRAPQRIHTAREHEARARRPGGRHTPHDSARAPRAPRRSPLLQHAHHLRHERSRQRRRRPSPDMRPARHCHVATPNLHGHTCSRGTRPRCGKRTPTSAYDDVSTSSAWRPTHRLIGLAAPPLSYFADWEPTIVV